MDTLLNVLKTVVIKRAILGAKKEQKDEWEKICSIMLKNEPVDKIDVMLSGKYCIDVDEAKVETQEIDAMTINGS